ncbi:ArsI/CadI family heavy metal resistance metalloenzyme [Oleiagrimonas citrea]|uniref:Glyoxalase/bleomycin resistance/dioxygenase family protein n=1 Tax=Oleiagrimonas citrea TaxID=1665687 RepID=A0A846ZNM5_9GAMM|nr:ArsI/CadI family heavy metal resistance metalloenzyme [Oleiagrimonas citrea]NKZ39442.1 glyoxalase/bleomycin resistance/dioxygenase family protein [Oleiagrimonas citrea]
MKRFHVHVNVENLEASIGFYRTLFGTDPTVVEADYAKWMLDDPRVNFAISQRGGAAGIDHLGLQADEAGELDELGNRLQTADAVTLAEQGTVCCYARSDKFWAQDPQGVRWETFRTLGTATTYTDAPDAASTGGPCCGASAKPATEKACC